MACCPTGALAQTTTRAVENEDAAATRPANDVDSAANQSTQSRPTVTGLRTFAELKGAIATHDSAVDRARLALNTAQRILVEETSPHLLEIVARGRTEPALQPMLDDAEKCMALAEEDLGIERTDANRAVRERIDLLRAFAGVFRGLSTPLPTTMADDGTSDARSKLLRACGELALYLDDPSAAIVESARLWQAVAYRLAGKPDRTIQVVRPFLKRPKTPDISLYSRLQRCLALGDQGHHEAGILLSLRLLGRLERWFGGDEASLEQARRSVNDVRIRLLKAWAEQVRRGGHEADAEQIEKQVSEALGEDKYPFALDEMLPLSKSIAGLEEIERD
jgi:hypothetical protein